MQVVESLGVLDDGSQKGGETVAMETILGLD